MRSQIQRGGWSPPAFRSALVAVPPRERDAWVNELLGIAEVPDDGPALPRDGVPYLPAPVESVLALVDRAPVGADDLVVDVGAGLGRVAMLVHLLTGARTRGVEIQPALVAAGRALIGRLGLGGVELLEGDAEQGLSDASVFFLYCPFSGERLARWLARVEPLGRRAQVTIGCVDVPLPPCDWLRAEEGPALDLYRSVRNDKTR